MSSDNYLEKFEELHTFSLMYKVLTSSIGTTGLNFSFDYSVPARQRELTSRTAHEKKRIFYQTTTLTFKFKLPDQDKERYGLSGLIN